ncbi:hypothetical protein IJ670_00280 [bacterium]|nr:hypothetical protein [bacterium]
MIRIIILLLFLFIFPAFASDNIVNTETENFAAIYEKLEEAEFEYIFGIDPNQPEEYKKYMYSPYPLFRTGVDMKFKTKTIPSGYYLLTPREKNNKTYILFKENGRISFTIPAYKEETIPLSFYKDKLPHDILNIYQKAAKKTMGFIGKIGGKKNQRTPIPPAYIEFDDRGEFWNMILYYGEKKYYLLFKKIQ